MNAGERIARDWAFMQLRDQGHTVAEIARVFDVHERTVWRALGRGELVTDKKCQ